MTGRRVLAAVIGVGLVGWAAVMAYARPPQTDEARRERMETLYGAFREQFSGVPEVTPAQVMALQESEQPPVVVDVRRPDEQAVSMIPGAISAAEFDARRDELAGRTVVAYCTIGYRSGAWAKARRSEGIDARNLAGSVLAWTHAGGTLVHDGAPTKRVHVYGSTWDLARSDYVGVW